MKKSAHLSLLTVALSSLLWGCGGGGSGNGSGGSAALGSADFAAVTGASVNLTDEAIARNTAAAAANQATNSGAGVDTSLLTAAQTGSSLRSKGVHDVLERLPKWLTPSGDGVLSAAETTDCSYGGSITVSSTSLSRLLLTQGTRVTLTADRCTENEDGVNVVIHGSLEAVVVSGSISSSGYPSSGTRLTFDFNRFQLNYSDSSATGAVGLDGGLSVAYSGTSSSSFTSTPLTSRPTLTTVIRYNGLQVRHTISDFQLVYNDSGFEPQVSGSATVNSNTPGLAASGRYRWNTSNPLTISSDRITSGTLSLSTPGTTPSVTVRFGQSCSPNSGTGCVTIQRTVNGSPQPTQTLTWAQFEALTGN